MHRAAGELVRSGVINVGDSTSMIATAAAEASTYAGVIRLVDQAQTGAAPSVRLADRLARSGSSPGFGDRWFCVVVQRFGRGGGRRYWWSPPHVPTAARSAYRDHRWSAVRQAESGREGWRGPGAAGGRPILLFDKTGTLTAGRPEVIHVLTAPDIDEAHVIGLAASLEQVSPHVVATAVVNAARERHIEVRLPASATEVHGCGIEGVVDGHAVGRQSAVDSGRARSRLWAHRAQRRADGPVADRFRGSR